MRSTISVHLQLEILDLFSYLKKIVNLYIFIKKTEKEKMKGKYVNTVGLRKEI